MSTLPTRSIKSLDASFIINGTIVKFSSYSNKNNHWFFYDLDGRIITSRFDLDTYRDFADLKEMFGD